MTIENTINRDKIYVGEVVLTETLARYPSNYQPKSDLDMARANQLYVDGWHTYRSMLFTINEQNCATDLLYSSQNYPVFGISSETDCIESNVVIKDAYNLAPLLKYFNYDDNLSLDDIIKIRKTFFTGRFGYDNCELFGVKKSDLGNYKFYRDSIDPNRRYKLYKKNTKLELVRQVNSILPMELMYILDERGYSLELLGLRTDPFKPNLLEGPIKKLK